MKRLCVGDNYCCINCGGCTQEEPPRKHFIESKKDLKIFCTAFSIVFTILFIASVIG